MLILVGLGNPGSAYVKNRHNIGFMAVDAIHGHFRFAPWRQKFQAEIAEGSLGGERVLLMKPLTYMNESGRAVAEAARFYKVEPGGIVVFHDELDLPPGKFRVKTGGGHGGHNGLRSITQHMGDAYRRVRLGIGHPGAKELVHGYVLHDFAKADQAWIDPLLAAMADNAELLADGKDATFANRVHLALQPDDGKPARGSKKADAAVKDAEVAPGTKPAAGSAPAAKKDAAEPTSTAAQGPLAAGLAKLFSGRR
ncbi:aminoacyl-tRNA hydrolase [Segnochrobactrum spirostomi]|uniref:Peptidyl-tRNA hydrolase n=1 Tax=Segnochrobactrum spirostomi TaxID=2608987 RepID=A0A6A7Y370_9HYPH|nr:aminoacyl-tRNA hydrolase [Segnochrobactrum spirostomi]MQT13560.1 aminoacyl-tRNA hydrolase [Segnochrobactrum spirostomi]